MNKIIGALLSLILIYNIALTLVTPILAALVKKIGGTLEETGTLFAIVTWVSCAALVISPQIKKKFRIGDFPFLVIGYLYPIISGIWLFYVKSVTELYVILILSSIAEAMTVPTVYKWYQDFLKESYSEQGWGFHDAALAISAGLGGLISGVLISGNNFNRIFIAYTIFASIAFISMLFVYRLYNKYYPHVKEMLAEET